jgi:mRNA interferase MazF
VTRGDVHAINLPRERGHVQHGRRYAVIVQADGLMNLSTVTVCPTSQSTPPASFHPEIQLNGEATKVACEMVRAVDARRLGDRVGHLRMDELRAVDDALKLVLELAP